MSDWKDKAFKGGDSGETEHVDVPAGTSVPRDWKEKAFGGGDAIDSEQVNVPTGSDVPGDAPEKDPLKPDTGA